MVCNRVVKENVGDMMDAVSLGEEVKDFCGEQKLCDLSFQGGERLILGLYSVYAVRFRHGENAEDAAGPWNEGTRPAFRPFSTPGEEGALRPASNCT